jgi:hypothetical protein
LTGVFACTEVIAADTSTPLATKAAILFILKFNFFMVILPDGCLKIIFVKFTQYN